MVTNSKTFTVQSVGLSARIEGPTRLNVNENGLYNGFASGGVAPFTYSWNFGDGSTGTGQIVTKKYALTGSYGIVLTIRDSAGKTAFTQRNVQVVSEPTPEPPPQDVEVTITKVENVGLQLFITASYKNLGSFEQEFFLMMEVFGAGGALESRQTTPQTIPAQFDRSLRWEPLVSSQGTYRIVLSAFTSDRQQLLDTAETTHSLVTELAVRVDLGADVEPLTPAGNSVEALIGVVDVSEPVIVRNVKLQWFHRINGSFTFIGSILDQNVFERIDPNQGKLWRATFNIPRSLDGINQFIAVVTVDAVDGTPLGRGYQSNALQLTTPIPSGGSFGPSSVRDPRIVSV